MRKTFLLFLVLALAATGILAQPQPGAPATGTAAQPNGGGVKNANAFGAMLRGALLYTDLGLLSVRGGVLVKIDPVTLKPVGNAIELFGPLPKFPEGDWQTNREAFTAYYAEVNQRLLQPIMILKDHALLVVIGTNFFKVNLDEMTIALDVNFAGKDEGNPGGVGTPAPAYELHEKTLYLLRPLEIVALNIDDGKFSRAPLPEPMIKILNPYQR